MQIIYILKYYINEVMLPDLNLYHNTQKSYYPNMTLIKLKNKQ